jgi:hypothetical protein
MRSLSKGKMAAHNGDGQYGEEEFQKRNRFMKLQDIIPEQWKRTEYTDQLFLNERFLLIILFFIIWILSKSGYFCDSVAKTDFHRTHFFVPFHDSSGRFRTNSSL